MFDCRKMTALSTGEPMAFLYRERYHRKFFDLMYPETFCKLFLIIQNNKSEEESTPGKDFAGECSSLYRQCSPETHACKNSNVMV